MSSKNKAKNLSDLARNNQTAMFAHTVEVSVMTVFCLLQALIGMQTFGYILIIVLLGFAPVIAERIAWARNKETPFIKHSVAIGFAIFYTFTLFTATNLLVFVFVVPMILVISIYNDTRYSLIINFGVVLENIILVALGASTGKFGFINSDYSIIQIVFVILVGIYSYMTSRTLNTNMAQKLDSLSRSQEETADLLKNISETAEKTEYGINDIYTDLTHLNEIAESTQTAMQDMLNGVNHTANAVQQQLSHTEAIQSQVDTADEAALQITENMEQTLDVLSSGSSEIALLVEKVDISVQNGADVAEKLKTLDKYIEEMQSIVGIISGIASQTALLSLNATIEAARAGEAGRGFAVVASEISGMATQTNDATSHITNLIQNVSASISEVVDVIYQMISSINEEKQSTEHTAATFETIQAHTLSIRDNITHLASNISELKQANQEIVASIQTISDISEELSVHANETMHSEEESAHTLEHISDKMQALIALSDR